MDNDTTQERASKRQRIEDAPEANLSASEREAILAAADRAVRPITFSSRRLNGKGRVSSPSTSSPVVTSNDTGGSPSSPSPSSPSLAPNPATTASTSSSSSAPSSSASSSFASSSSSSTTTSSAQSARSALRPPSTRTTVQDSKKQSSNTFMVTALQELRRVEEDARNQQDVAFLEREVELLRKGLAARDGIIKRLRAEVEEKDKILKSLPRELVVNWVVTQRMLTRQALDVDVLNTL